MPGLDPGIHVVGSPEAPEMPHHVDGRVKPGHDDCISFHPWWHIGCVDAGSLSRKLARDLFNLRKSA
jgi:hypothetical protein